MTTTKIITLLYAKSLLTFWTARCYNAGRFAHQRNGLAHPAFRTSGSPLSPRSVMCTPPGRQNQGNFPNCIPKARLPLHQVMESSYSRPLISQPTSHHSHYLTPIFFLRRRTFQTQNTFGRRVILDELLENYSMISTCTDGKTFPFFSLSAKAVTYRRVSCWHKETNLGISL